MKIVRDLVPTDSTKMYRYEKCNADGTGKGEYDYLKPAFGELAQVPTPINAALFEDMYGYANEVLTITDDAVVCTSGDVTETTTILENGNVQTTKTDGTKTVTVTLKINDNGTFETVVS